MPSVGERFRTFRQFASASLRDIYGDKLDNAFQVTANHLASGVWMNREGKDGKPKFVWQPFPRFAQIAPTFGMVILDYDHDGIMDLHLTQNSYSTQPETGLWRGGLSQLLKGNGDGTFTCIPATESGLVISEDGKASALVDLNGDYTPDIIATQNNSSSRTFLAPKKDYLEIRLKGKAGNPSAIGSRVSASYENGEERVHEIKSASGYLSQPSPAVYLDVKGLKSMKIWWPDGKTSGWQLSSKSTSSKVVLDHP